MQRGKPTDAVVMDNIQIMLESGLSAKKIAEIVGCTNSLIYTVSAVRKAVEDMDYDALVKYRYRNVNVINWAAERSGKDPAAVLAQIDAPAAPEQPKPNEDNTALAFAALLEAIKDLRKSVDAIDKRLSAMQMTMQSARQEAVETGKKIVETININGDIITKEYDRLSGLLESIKMNTKKFGKPGQQY